MRVAVACVASLTLHAATCAQPLLVRHDGKAVGNGHAFARGEECFVVSASHVVAHGRDFDVVDRRGTVASAQVVKRFREERDVDPNRPAALARYDVLVARVKKSGAFNCSATWDASAGPQDALTQALSTSVPLTAHHTRDDGSAEMQRLLIRRSSESELHLLPFGSSDVFLPGDSGTFVTLPADTAPVVVGMIIQVDRATGLVTALPQPWLNRLFGDVLNVLTPAAPTAVTSTEIRDAMKCSGVRPEDLALAIRARNGDRAIEIVHCKREFIVASEPRQAVASLFRALDFARSERFLTQLRKEGVSFVADYRPVNPDRSEEYFSSPLRTALAESNAEAITWLAAGGDRDAWAAYPGLLAIEFRRPAFVEPRRQERVLATVSQAIKAGLPVDFNEHEAFRQVYRAWMQSNLGPDIRALGAGARSRDWQSLFGDARPIEQSVYWRSLAKLLQPEKPLTRDQILAKAHEEFARPRLDGLNRLEVQLVEMTKQGGLRTVNDPMHPLGARNIDVSAGQMTDSDLVVDSYGLLSADGWASVGTVRSTLRSIAAAKQQLAAQPTP